MTRIAAELGELDTRGKGVASADVHTARLGIDAVAALLTAAGIPTSLEELGLQRVDLAEVVRLSLTATRLVENNPRELTVEACSRIVEAAYRGDRGFVRADR
jgi:alcohol dehydrogenase class IV